MVEQSADHSLCVSSSQLSFLYVFILSSNKPVYEWQKLDIDLFTDYWLKMNWF